MAKLTNAAFAPVESLRDRALGILRQATVSGEIKAGEIYSATALAKQLGVSVSPVREAMLTLVNEGIMVAVRNRGFQVAPMTMHDRREVFELRMLLEVPSVAELATLDISSHRTQIDRYLEIMDALAAQGNVNEYLRQDREFHLSLIRIHGNVRLVNFVATLRDQTRLYGMQRFAEANKLQESSAEHRDIVAAIVAGDKARTAELMTKHLGHISSDWSDV